MTNRPAAAPKAFTMMELLVTIAVIGMMLAILMPGVQSARETARRSSCGNNLRQIGVALANFADARRRFPPGQYMDPSLASVAGNRVISWSAFFLEFLDQREVAPTWDAPPSVNPATPAPDGRLYLKALMGSVWNQRATSTVVPPYRCPSAVSVHPTREDGRIRDYDGSEGLDPAKFEGMACMDYAGNGGATSDARYPRSNGTVYPASKPSGTVPSSTGVLIDQPVSSMNQGVPATWITDGLSKTLLVVELSGRGLTGNGTSGSPRGAWASGLNCVTIGPKDTSVPIVNPFASPTSSWPDSTANALFSDHRNGSQVVLCDGAVDFVRDDVDELVLVHLATKADGEFDKSPQ